MIRQSQNNRALTQLALHVPLFFQDKLESSERDDLQVLQAFRVKRRAVDQATCTTSQSNTKINVPPRGGELSRVEALLHWIVHLHMVDVRLGNVVPARNDAILLRSGVLISCSAVAS
jgi:hypothetical protein